MLMSAMLTCLALNIYHESRGEPIQGQIAVALVTRNRMEIENKSACEVVFRDKQFSWANNMERKISGGKIEIEKSYLPDQKDKAWLRALYIANLIKYIPDFTGGATHFHGNTIDPWPDMEVTFVVGKLTFCKDEGYIEKYKLMRMR